MIIVNTKTLLEYQSTANVTESNVSSNQEPLKCMTRVNLRKDFKKIQC